MALLACALCGPLSVGAAYANDVIMGVNVEDVGHMNEQQQDALLDELQQHGVKTIRTGMLNRGMLDPKFAHFVVGAFKRGIQTVLLIYPTQGGAGKHTAPTNPRFGRRWPIPALSDADPQGFRDWLAPQMAAMESAQVRFAAFELGNEFNTPGFNGDFPVPGTGRVLGISELSNANDSEGNAIAAGYKAYLKNLAVLKDARDHSQINRATPVLLGGLANVDLPKAQSYNKVVAAAIPDTIQFLRRNGLDELVDGYAVHFYPSGDPRQSVSARTATLQNILGECRKDTKPCWLTEWNFNNGNKSCPINDAARLQLVQTERKAFEPFVVQGRLKALLWYSWNGDYVGEKENPGAIFRCGALTDAGRLALSPM
jgi:hypothetical protein